MSGTDRLIVGLELGYAVVVGLAFLVPYAVRLIRNPELRRSSWGWHMVAITAVMVGEAGAFLLLLVGVRVPTWVFQFGFGLIDVVATQRFWLFIRDRNRPAGTQPPTDG